MALVYASPISAVILMMTVTWIQRNSAPALRQVLLIVHGAQAGGGIRENAEKGIHNANFFLR